MNQSYKPFFSAAAVALSALAILAVVPGHAAGNGASHKQQVVELLKSIETGDSEAALYINPQKYIQHHLTIADGLAGFKTLYALPKGSVKVNTVRVFQDGDYVFAHTDYDLYGPKIGFDILRFEQGKIVEHWDNLQDTPAKPNPSGRSMIDGETVVSDLDKTKANKALVHSFVDDILLNRRMDKLAGYYDGDNYIQHNPQIADGLSGLSAALQARAKAGLSIKYTRIHEVLGEGNFVLVVSEGTAADKPVSLYDLFRVQDGKIAEHWDVHQSIPPQSEWKNQNGKFGF
jgi:predicted SnoaL-like aldol condensation-catalyzing enzyme